jgi:hypothetical protein
VRECEGTGCARAGQYSSRGSAIVVEMKTTAEERFKSLWHGRLGKNRSGETSREALDVRQPELSRAFDLVPQWNWRSSMWDDR